LKPNVSTMVGALYSPEDNRRDAGFSIFYMGINLGAVISPLACGWVGEKVNWHWGFGLAGIGMTIGLIQYLMGAKHLGTAGLYPVPAESPEAAARLKKNFLITAGIIAVLGALLTVLPVTAQGVADAGGVLLLVITFATFAWLIFFAEAMPVERKRFVVIFVLFLAASLFWSAFEQAGSTLNLFAERSTDKVILGFEYPASWFQSVNSLFIITLAPVLGWYWLRLGKRNPSSPAKFAFGLIFVGLGFLVMVVGALAAANGVRVSSAYLWVCYLLHTIGELCLSPVGLSAMTKLAPVRFVGLMMGIWFLATSVGNYLGGRLASLYGSVGVPTLFGIVAAFSIALGLVLAFMVKPIKAMMGGVK
jgi:POT family proton-dependent oligopeptide transporter